MGHLADGFLAKRAAPRVPLAFLVFCTTFLDVLWPIFILLGIEHAKIVPGITAASPFDFRYYPWSHSLLMAALWSLLAAFPWLVSRRGREALVIAVCVFSHAVQRMPDAQSPHTSTQRCSWHRLDSQSESTSHTASVTRPP